MNIEQVRAALEAKLNEIPTNPDIVEGLSRQQWADMHNARRAAERQLTTFDRLVARLSPARETVARLTRQIKILTAADAAFVAEQAELEPKATDSRDWREAQRITNRLQELKDALRQVHAGLVATGWSHPAVEAFLREKGEPAPVNGSNVWTTQRYSPLPVLKTRLVQAQQELSAVEDKIQRESAC